MDAVKSTHSLHTLFVAGVLGLLAPGAAPAAPPTAPAPWVAAVPSALRVSAVADPAGWTEVGLAISPASGVQRLLLREPLALAPGEEVLFDAALSCLFPIRMNVLARDADGREFLFRTQSYETIQGDNFLGGRFRGGLDELGVARVRAAGLANPVRESWAPAPGNGEAGPPRLPLRILGLTIERRDEGSSPDARLYLSTFRKVVLDPHAEPFHYSWLDEERFGSIEGDPILRATDIGPLAGPRHILDWELRDSYDGEPVLRGTEHYNFRPDDPRPWKLRFAEGVRIPTRSEGTHWVRARVRSGFAPDGTPRIDRTLDFRLDVWRAKGDEIESHADGAEKESHAESAEFAEVLPDSESQPSVLSRPAQALPPWSPPAGVPSWRDVRDGPEPLVLFSPMVREDEADPVARHAEIMDEMIASGDSRAMEIQNRWPDCEPLPGQYDFRALDGILAEARRRGIRCFVTFAPLDPPEWMPSHFTMDADGNRFGHTMYLFHGGRINLFFHPYVRARALDYLRALVAHLRDDPAVLGWFLITEHSGEAPWHDWYEGFDPATLAGFRAAARRRHGTLDAANAAWGTAFASWDAVRPPSVKEEAPSAFRLEWLAWRRDMREGFFVDAARLVRSLDPHRVLMVYDDGIPIAERLAPYGCLTANGGCATPLRFLRYAAVAEAGIPQRAEEITCSRWEAFPYQLDLSLFSMMAGGGANAHVKMFIPQGWKFAEHRAAPDGLGRFERFLPLWRELRGARPVAGAVRAWSSADGVLLRTRSITPGTFAEGWPAQGPLDSQLPVAPAVGDAWTNAAVVVVNTDDTWLSPREEAALIDYARGGGTLVLSAANGRHVAGRDAEDWCLLRDLGFPAPAADVRPGWGEMTAEPGSRWAARHSPDPDSLRSRFQDRIEPPRDADIGEVLLRCLGDGAPALTCRPVGRGRAYVLWAANPAPLSATGRGDRLPYLREIAGDAGAPMPVSTTHRGLWTILLRDDPADAWWLLLCAGGDPVSGATVRLELPEGTWQGAERIGGATLPARPAASLASDGFPVSMEKNQVHAWKFTRAP